jgi:hypothetical protein
MDRSISAEELRWLRALDTDSPTKPDVPPAVADVLVEQGLAIRLVEGGLQLTTLGRDRLAHASSSH